MYSLPRGPTKINTTTRNVRGLQKQRDNFDFNESHGHGGKKRHDGYQFHMSSPRPTFNGSNNKGNNHHHAIARTHSEPFEFESQQHQEITAYLSESWIKVCKECDHSKRKDQESGPLWYQEKTPNPKLTDFKPFDLDEWWGERLLKKVTESC